MEPLRRSIMLAAGGALGVNARYWLGLAIGQWDGRHWPWATFAINVSGSFVLGVLATLFARWSLHPDWVLFAMTGFLGGYTTFSTFELESLVLWEGAGAARSIAYMAGSVACGFAAVAAGMILGRWLAPGGLPDGP